MKLTTQEKKAIEIDLKIKNKWNLSDEQFEDYVERVGILIYMGGKEENDAIYKALGELKR